MTQPRLFCLLLLLLSLSTDASGQDKFCKVKFKIDGLHFWHSIWNSVEFTSSSTTRDEQYFLANGIDKFAIDSLPMDKYQVSLTSVFGDRITQAIDLTKRTRISLSFDVTDFYQEQYRSTSFIKRLSVGDSLIIFETKMGCFGGDKTLYTIFREKEKIRVTIKDGWFFNETYKDIELDVRLLDKLEGFERRIAKLDEKGSCTTSYQYSLVHKEQYRYYSFARCQHENFSRFLDELSAK